MDEKLKNASEDLRKAMEVSAESKVILAAFESASRQRIDTIKKALSEFTLGLKPVFEEKGKGLEVITPVRNANLFEVLYYPEIVQKESRGVNTAALRIEFQPETGKARILRSDTFFDPFSFQEIVDINEAKSLDRLEEVTLDFTKQLATK
jgi:hypothetical protein